MADRAVPTPSRSSAALASTAAAAVAVLSIALAPAASAGGYIDSDTYLCNEGQVSIKPPRTWTTNARPEQVFWSPVLFRWQGDAWVPVFHHNFAIATVNNQGYAVVGWTDVVDYYGVGVRSFVVSQPGQYAVANYLVWASDASTLLSWADPPDSTGYCTFTSGTAALDRDAPAEAVEQEQSPSRGLGARVLQFARQVVALYLAAMVGDSPSPTAGEGPPAPDS